MPKFHVWADGVHASVEVTAADEDAAIAKAGEMDESKWTLDWSGADINAEPADG